MKRSTITLADGRTLRPAERAHVWYLDDGTTARAEITGDHVRLFVPGSGGAELADGRIVQAPEPQPAVAATGRETKPGAKNKDRRRWVTFNTFVDRVARHLDDAEAAVWFVIFRWTQDDTADIRISDIAARIGKSTRSVQRAVDRLAGVGLIERLKRGTRQGGPSRYRLDPDPAAALPKLQADTPPQHDTGDTLKRTPKHQARDRRGVFTTGRP